MRKLFHYGMALLLVLALLVGAGGCSGSSSETTGEKPTIVVGSKTFTEALLLGTMTYYYLQDLGYPVENKVGLGELAVIRPALESGEIGCYWEYTGTVLINVMQHEPSFDEEESFNLVKEWDAKNGIIWLDYAPLNDTYGIMVRKDIADKYNLKTTSELIEQIKKGEKLRFVSTQEYNERPDGLAHFEEVYGFKYPRDLVINAALNVGYEALKTGQAEVGLAFTTDARVKAYNLVMLEDDKKCFPVYNAAPLFRKEILEAYPEIPEQMKKLSSLLDNDTIMELNKQVDVDKKSVGEVAKDFLKKNGLIK
ncbi:ABC-type glycine betaine transport system, substrate-binding domain protein [Thermacetogenium phaeum DSM 12270]|uniref:ABC-type glycine betaine transport system, substrate-binding domain protein n=1 Tax=Thermacetogenium phaeum (strain ATCC BAA-254 / DSM 26808 / PB) TaxID=1089553 RepID=K4LJK2_THEPS|nr:glycine betaine ABC transporter substrate-binding protein [Thermacetogenium phaeum]AFV12232.1 ABC-type glycine betaine transport system, substrate-binding domain protein [Thermacetogenium phaeum DSM 12270]